jgi:O-antigen ligase
LAVGYAGILILTVFYLRKWRWWKKLALIGLIIIAPVIAFKTMHGFEMKIRYMVYDFEQFMKGEGVQHSDSERWMSMKAGLDIGRQHLWFGTGPGHYRPTLEAYYREVFQMEKYTRPHNQFINVFACLGLVGLAVFLIVLIFPMTFRLFWKPPLIPTLYLMQVLPLMVEHPLDTALGTSMFMLFTMMGLSFQEGQMREG